MSTATPAGSRTRSDVWTGALAAWCALWLVVGAWTGYELWQLADIGATVADSGRALDAAGVALQGLADVPLVGESTTELGSQVRSNAADVVAEATGARGSLRRLAVLLGLALALLPSVPAAALLVRSRRRHALPPRG